MASMEAFVQAPVLFHAIIDFVSEQLNVGRTRCQFIERKGDELIHTTRQIVLLSFG